MLILFFVNFQKLFYTLTQIFFWKNENMLASNVPVSKHLSLDNKTLNCSNPIQSLPFFFCCLPIIFFNHYWKGATIYMISSLYFSCKSSNNISSGVTLMYWLGNYLTSLSRRRSWNALIKICFEYRFLTRFLFLEKHLKRQHKYLLFYLD